MHFFGFFAFFSTFFQLFSKKNFLDQKIFFPKSANFSRKNEKMTKKTILRGPRPLKTHFLKKKFFLKKIIFGPKLTKMDAK